MPWMWYMSFRRRLCTGVVTMQRQLNVARCCSTLVSSGSDHVCPSQGPKQAGQLVALALLFRLLLLLFLVRVIYTRFTPLRLRLCRLRVPVPLRDDGILATIWLGSWFPRCDGCVVTGNRDAPVTGYSDAPVAHAHIDAVMPVFLWSRRREGWLFVWQFRIGGR